MIVPCYNEAAVLDRFYEVLREKRGALDGYDLRLLFVDDGSADETAAILERLAENDDRVQYISFSRNFGKEAAMLAGLEHAGGDYIGFIDADLQHSPDLIPDMLHAVDAEGYDVAACRRADRKGESALKSVLSAAFYKVVNRMTDTYIDDGAQDYRIFTRQVADAMLSMPESNRFTKGIFSWVGFKTKWFVHENAERAAGESKWSLTKLMRYALDGIIGYTDAPLKLPIGLSGVSFAAALAFLIVFIVKLCTGAEPSVYYAWLVLFGIFCVGAMTLAGVGILGAYLARIYTEAKGRPRYIVRKTNIKK